jgi:hypothetical protein
MGLLEWVLIGLSYVGLVFLHWGLYLSDLQFHSYITRDRRAMEAELRHDLLYSLLAALLPFMWVVVPILTGGYPHGWKLYWRVK